ncbi:potassium transporter Kef [Leptospira wolffii]|uniref:monovalent cation:proton antiporter-2 (CPA2) family protein n=1 Tax=Leptospira wolffii TaxID=409998 RepID=UPI0003485736|nr:monovalent cation:proton antiporter-2 (CPA2) family protein [Leptospira wolffii]TGK61987.1 potassium transporter Kef [Leptospira wolffii]TGK68587.1 potassium transporter Kef [Leptospira wolffii]TGK74629.1 potassium transporter Kef [Leptospira wolffii]TGL31795.1 potassium transporter Kef [Leptospira wolffii]
MEEKSLIVTAIILLTTAVLCVPIFKKFGIGSIIGYVAGGILIGPHGIRLVTGGTEIMHFAEFGVVLLLFLIGLELRPQTLWVLRKPVFGMGISQVLLTSLILAASISYLFQLNLVSSVILGLSLSLSSTAFALQSLAEKNQLKTNHGRSAFAILLFQDLAVIPIMAILPLAAMNSSSSGNESLDLYKLGTALLAIILVVLSGRFLMRPLFRMIAASGNHEIFVALSLLLVLGVSLAMEKVGLSMALGSFLGGVLLADSEYRHELEANLEPFKGLLLGLFFLAVGMSMNLEILISNPLLILALAFGLLSVKGIVLFLIGRVSKLNSDSSSNLAVTISQGGEFAFVILNVAVQLSILEKNIADYSIVIVTVSMLLTPFVGIFKEKWIDPYTNVQEERPADPIHERNRVIIAGFGRVGQIVARMLYLHKVGFTALEHNADQVNSARKFGHKIYYGDASRLDLLVAAGAAQADILVLAVQDAELSVKIATIAKEHFPNLKIIARARNRSHYFDLLEVGIETIRRDTFASSLEIAQETLVDLGFLPSEVEYFTQKFRNYDEAMILEQYKIRHSEKEMIAFSKNAIRQLEEAFARDMVQKEAS